MCERNVSTHNVQIAPHGFGAGFGNELAPVVETGVEDLMDMLARAVGTQAWHRRGRWSDLRRSWPGIDRPRPSQVVVQGAPMGGLSSKGKVRLLWT